MSARRRKTDQPSRYPLIIGLTTNIGMLIIFGMAIVFAWLNDNPLEMFIGTCMSMLSIVAAGEVVLAFRLERLLREKAARNHVRAVQAEAEVARLQRLLPAGEPTGE